MTELEQNKAFFATLRAYLSADSAEEEARIDKKLLSLLGIPAWEKKENWVRAEELPLRDRPIWTPYKD